MIKMIGFVFVKARQTAAALSHVMNLAIMLNLMLMETGTRNLMYAGSVEGLLIRKL